jgi:hypothetical protein
MLTVRFDRITFEYGTPAPTAQGDNPSGVGGTMKVI